jgi:hypothetical protein
MNLQETIRRILQEESRKKQKVYYGFSKIKNTWVDDDDKTFGENYFEGKHYKDYTFDNFNEMDKKFGHKNSLFGTRGLEPGDPKRSSRSFDMYNKQYGPLIVRVVTGKKDHLNEVRVPRSERVELYKDDNIIVVVPLTHRALQKYATNCQWCINDDSGEWKHYHQGKHAVIIQRKPKKEKIGITGQPIASEILMMDRWDNDHYKFQDVCEILGYQFKDEQEMGDYYVTVSNDIDNFATNIVYYSPENGIYDMEDNSLWGFNIEINDIPNVTPEVIKIMDDYLNKS